MMTSWIAKLAFETENKKAKIKETDDTQMPSELQDAGRQDLLIT